MLIYQPILYTSLLYTVLLQLFCIIFEYKITYLIFRIIKIFLKFSNTILFPYFIRYTLSILVDFFQLPATFFLQ